MGRETGGCRGGWASGGLDNELMGCGLQDVGDLAVLQKMHDMICNVEASCGLWLGALT